jgi:hypothetical protein
LDGPSRVVYDGGADSILQFRFERGGDRMKWRKRVRFGSMRRKRDTTRRCGDVDWRRGGTGKEKRRR